MWLARTGFSVYVADVVYGALPEDRVWRVDGKRNMGLDIYKASGQNIVELCQRVKKEMDAIEARTEAEFHYNGDIDNGGGVFADDVDE